jgi:L-ascorbate metabolism protein UlaG (beta-lactamase superfamily)
MSRKESVILMSHETAHAGVSDAAAGPDADVDPASPSTPDSGSLFFIGTATVLFQLGPFTVLTDPNFLHRGESVGIGYGLLRSKRLTEPAISIDALPPLDMVVLSHHHEDHFDRVATEQLDPSVPILTTPDAARALRKVGFRNARALETWQQESFVREDWLLTVTSMPGTHGPALMTPFLPSVMGSLLELRQIDSSQSLRIYISGDTLVYDQLKEIPARYPGIDLALLHLGGTRIFGVLLTMDGKQGVEAIRLVNPETAVPIHYDDYDIFKSPLEDFRREVRAANLESRIKYVARGQTIPLPPATRKTRS